MNSFVDRDAELSSLRRAFEGRGAELYVLYGRRRLGKTTLLKTFADGLPGVYHVADRSTEGDAIRQLARTMSVALGEPTLETSPFSDWYALFAAYDRLRNPRRSLLILDEFQYLSEVQPAFASIVQKWWDEHWSKQNLMVVLCGSVVSMMYRETLSRSSPLYGRRTGQWLLRPLRFSAVTEFFPRLRPREKVDMWALTGGVPRYAELCSGSKGFSDALEKVVLTRGAPLYAETRFLLQDEVTIVNVYWSLLHAISSGATRISELAGRLGQPANQLTRYLKTLQDLALVRREVPVTEGNPERSKKGTYVMDDAFLRLWFGAVAPFESLLEFGRTAEAARRMKDRLTSHRAWAFEQVCRQHLEDTGEVFGVSRVGRYWDRSTEIDVVGVDSDGRPIVAGECKWSSSPVGSGPLQMLRRKVERTWPDRSPAIRLVVFAAGGFTQAARQTAAGEDAVLIDCKELVAPRRAPGGLNAG